MVQVSFLNTREVQVHQVTLHWSFECGNILINCINTTRRGKTWVSERKHLRTCTAETNSSLSLSLSLSLCVCVYNWLHVCLPAWMAGCACSLARSIVFLSFNRLTDRLTDWLPDWLTCFFRVSERVSERSPKLFAEFSNIADLLLLLLLLLLFLFLLLLLLCSLACLLACLLLRRASCSSFHQRSQRQATL